MRRAQTRYALILLLLFPLCGSAQSVPDELSSSEFWSLVTAFSEPEGTFFPQYMSNEDSAQFVIPALKETTPPGGVYVGVGLEQNFTYIAALRPRMAFIVDIRRDNLLQHLLYKALFELSQNRADFVGRLFSRPRPGALPDTAGVTALFEAFESVPTDPVLYDETLQDVLKHLAAVHEIHLDEADRSGIARILAAFRTGGLQLRGQGDSTNPTFEDLMTAEDLSGAKHGFLASEENFGFIRQLHRKNLIVPVVGDFAGPKALGEIGRYLKERKATVSVFYVSNVERYLFPASHARFYDNTAGLPLTPSSLFIRSITSDISVRLGIPVSDVPAKWRTFLVPIRETLAAFSKGELREYGDLWR